MPTVLLRTIHGSHLYGLSNPQSDLDYFTVVTKSSGKYAKQKINNGVDEYTVDITTFINRLSSGVPQYLEACFSPVAEIDVLKDWRASLKVGSSVAPTYLRTIKNFCFSDSFKARRHGLRLALKLRDILAYGRFNPVLSSEDGERITHLAEDGDVYEKALSLLWGTQM